MAPQAPVSYDDVEVLDDDGLGFTCRIGNERVFVGKYVPIEGTAIRRKGDRGRLTLPPVASTGHTEDRSAPWTGALRSWVAIGDSDGETW